MCTVTYIPSSDKSPFVLTSNRDEKDFRPTLIPEIYKVGDKELAFPKDEKAGGSWIAANQTGKICCLLNGGFEIHKKEAHHTISRGTILLDFTASNLTIENYFSAKELKNVEPFTIVTILLNDNSVDTVSEFVWDGEKKHFKQLDKNSPYIWSSATLYNKEHRKMRKEWFYGFFTKFQNSLSRNKIIDFHSGEHTNDESINVVMERDGGLKTVSITQITTDRNNIQIHYRDLLNKSVHDLEL